MTNEMKLLRAFIEASGFDIEQTEIITLDGVPLPKPDMRPGAFMPIEADDIRSIIRVTDYKVTKKVTSANEAWQERALRNWRTPYNEKD